MTTTTKVLLAAFALFVGVLIVYYGIISPSGQPSPASATVTENDAQKPHVSDHADSPKAGGNSFLTDSVNQAVNTPHTNVRTDNSVDAGPLGSVAGDPLVLNADDRSTPDTRSLVADQARSTPPTANPSTRVSIDRNNIAGTPIDPAADSTPRNPPVRSAQSQTPGSSSTLSQAKTEYVVKSGDTLSSIAQDWFGEPRKWVLISRENPLADPNRLKIGQKLRLPSKDTPLEAAAKPMTAVEDSKSARSDSTATASAGGIHTVKAGDTLSSIARAAYGDESKWYVIFEANKSALHDDADALQIGMKLVIPKKQTS
ncbi:MAG TPA: LysM peptidoglycan-binding domain-containing protein [Phycisphaerales bacterium]|nr:LysM peptidoglycan-binding domain-containing protein [Phycisphaerales bacterium]